MCESACGYRIEVEFPGKLTERPSGPHIFAFTTLGERRPLKSVYDYQEHDTAFLRHLVNCLYNNKATFMTITGGNLLSANVRDISSAITIMRRIPGICIQHSKKS